MTSEYDEADDDDASPAGDHAAAGGHGAAAELGWLARRALRDMGLSLAEIEAVYGPVSPELPEAPEALGDAQDDPSEPLKTAKSDKQDPLTPVWDMDDLERLHRRNKIESDQQDAGLRKVLAVWSVVAASTMLLLGTGIFITYMISEWGNVPVAAIMGWLSASVIEVLGIVYLVANYLFPQAKDGSE